MVERKCLCGRGAAEFEDRRSRFIGEAFPVQDENHAREQLAEVKKEYPDARHHCWAWIMPDGACRWSDDGEPGGTAGGPIANVLKGAGVYGAMCVVTRYFGGILLGSGGLVRAYSKAAALAVSAAGTQPDPVMTLGTVACPWDCLDKVHRLVRETYSVLLDADYESDPAQVLLSVRLPEEAVADFQSRLTDTTGGRARWKTAP